MSLLTPTSSPGLSSSGSTSPATGRKIVCVIRGWEGYLSGGGLDDHALALDLAEHVVLSLGLGIVVVGLVDVEDLDDVGDEVGELLLLLEFFEGFLVAPFFLGDFVVERGLFGFHDFDVSGWIRGHVDGSYWSSIESLFLISSLFSPWSSIRTLWVS